MAVAQEKVDVLLEGEVMAKKAGFYIHTNPSMDLVPHFNITADRSIRNQYHSITALQFSTPISQFWAVHLQLQRLERGHIDNDIDAIVYPTHLTNNPGIQC